MILYLLVIDYGLNEHEVLSAHPEPQDTSAAYHKWYDELTARGQMHPYENGIM